MKISGKGMVLMEGGVVYKYPLNPVGFQSLEGKTLVRTKGLLVGSSFATLWTEDEIFEMYHSQDCCEEVFIEEITGDIPDLIGRPILKAEECCAGAQAEPGEDANLRTFQSEPDPYPDGRESTTYTFYRLITIASSVVIRWRGESNGYYSERVDFNQRTNLIGLPPGFKRGLMGADDWAVAADWILYNSSHLGEIELAQAINNLVDDFESIENEVYRFEEDHFLRKVLEDRPRYLKKWSEF
jgi:hypothetical protein